MAMNWWPQMACLWSAWAALSAASAGCVRAAPADPLEALRQQMVDNQIRPGGVRDPRVIKTMLKTPRHEFLPADLQPKAYDDLALPIGDKFELRCKVLGLLSDAGLIGRETRLASLWA